MEHEFDPRDLEPAAPTGDTGRKRRLLPAAIAVGALSIFGAIVWYAYNQSHRDSSPGGTPLIKADASPTKVKPDDPGGLDVPHQDKLVLNNLAGGQNSAPPPVERLLPGPETPAQPPVTTPAAPAPATPVAAPAPAATPAPKPVVAPPAAVAPVPAAPAPAAPPAPAHDATAATVHTEPPAKVAAIAPEKPSPAVTPKPVAAAAAPVVKAGGGSGYRVQLASVRSEELAKAEWVKLQKANPELSALQLTVQTVEIPDKGTYYRIQAGPLADAPAAASLCADLKAKQQGCMVVKP